MPFPGRWFTPHTTRFGSADSGSSVLDYITSYQADDSPDPLSPFYGGWAQLVGAGGPLVTGPVQSTAPAARPAPAEILDYLDFPAFTRYHLAQAWSWWPLASIDPAVSFPGYTDAPPDLPFPLAGVEYEAPGYGTILPTPRTEFVLVTGGGNLALPTALIDVLMFSGLSFGMTPGYTWLTGIGLTAGTEIGSLDSAGPSMTWIGPTVDPTDSIVVCLASDAEFFTNFPYDTTSSASGFQQFGDLGVLVEYLGPRFRFLYDVEPPQRQFPRDDGLGASTRRSQPTPTSVQFGQRRGPTAVL